MHVEGSAFKSGRIKTGDTLVSVDGQIIGADNLLAGKLVRCGPPTGGDLTQTDSAAWIRRFGVHAVPTAVFSLHLALACTLAPTPCTLDSVPHTYYPTPWTLNPKL